MLKVFVLVSALAALASNQAHAGVFDIPRFVESGEFKVGLEPEVTLQKPSGVAMSLKYTHGISDLFNLQGLVGTGGGSKQFRVGSALTFDAFPDVEGQPGIGLSQEFQECGVDAHQAVARMEILEGKVEAQMQHRRVREL